MFTQFFDRRDWSLVFPMSTQYFYDENGHRIVDPAEQQAWVKQHPEHPYGYGVPMGDGPKEDPPEPIEDAGNPFVSDPIAIEQLTIRSIVDAQWRRGRLTNPTLDYLYLWHMPVQCDCGDCNDCYFRDAGNPANYIKC